MNDTSTYLCECGHTRSEHSKDMTICRHTDPKKEDSNRSRDDNGKLYGWIMCPCNTFKRKGNES